jgi:hypothetical protein
MAALGLATTRGVKRFELDPAAREARLLLDTTDVGTMVLHMDDVDDVAWVVEGHPARLHWLGSHVHDGPLAYALNIDLPPHHMPPFVQSLRGLFGHDPDHAEVPCSPNTAPATSTCLRRFRRYPPPLTPSQLLGKPRRPRSEVPESAPRPPDHAIAEVEADAASRQMTTSCPRWTLGRTASHLLRFAEAQSARSTMQGAWSLTSSPACRTMSTPVIRAAAAGLQRR